MQVLILPRQETLTNPRRPSLATMATSWRVTPVPPPILTRRPLLRNVPPLQAVTVLPKRLARSEFWRKIKLSRIHFWQLEFWDSKVPWWKLIFFQKSYLASLRYKLNTGKVPYKQSGMKCWVKAGSYTTMAGKNTHMGDKPCKISKIRRFHDL